MTDDRTWMRPALAWLFDHVEVEQARWAITDTAAFNALRSDISNSVTPTHPDAIPAGDLGNNLILGLIAHRVKFTRVVALAKLERNLAMRPAS